MIIISRPATTSFFNDEKSAKASKHCAGRKLAKRSISLRKRNKPRSGFTLKSRSSYFGPPTAPSKTASTSWALAIVSSCSGVPCASYAQPPTKSSNTSKGRARLAPYQSITLRTSVITSGPIPSPAKIRREGFVIFKDSFGICHFAKTGASERGASPAATPNWFMRSKSPAYTQGWLSCNLLS